MEKQELLSKLRRLELRTKGLSKHLYTGEYHAFFKGRGMTFSEVRDYQYGDDVRAIDWNVTARYQSPFVKVFEEERELTIMLIVDISGSMLFGTCERTKKELALEIAAIVAFSASFKHDNVGLLLVSDCVERYIPPGKGRKHTLFILHELIEYRARSKGSNLNEGLKFLRNTQKKRTITFLISDFKSENKFVDELSISNQKHDLICINISDEAEYKLPDLGFVQLYHAESGKTSWINSSSLKFRKEYKAICQEQDQDTENMFKKNGIDHIICSTTSDVTKLLLDFFNRRR